MPFRGFTAAAKWKLDRRDQGLGRGEGFPRLHGRGEMEAAVAQSETAKASGTFRGHPTAAKWKQIEAPIPDVDRPLSAVFGPRRNGSPIYGNDQYGDCYFPRSLDRGEMEAPRTGPRRHTTSPCFPRLKGRGEMEASDRSRDDRGWSPRLPRLKGRGEMEAGTRGCAP